MESENRICVITSAPDPALDELSLKISGRFFSKLLVPFFCNYMPVKLTKSKLIVYIYIYIYIQSGARNVIPFYHPIKIVTSWYRCCKRATEGCSS